MRVGLPSFHLGRINHGGVIDAGLQLLRTAASWYSTNDIVSEDQQALPNRGDNPENVSLPHDGTNYVWFPGTTSNRLTSPVTHTYSASASVVAYMQRDDNDTVRGIAGFHDGGTSSGLSIRTHNTDAFQSLYHDGTSYRSSLADPVTHFGKGETDAYWLRVDHTESDAGFGGNTVHRWYTSDAAPDADPEAIAWDLRLTSDLGGSYPLPASNSDVFAVGGYGGATVGSTFAGKVWRARYYAGVFGSSEIEDLNISDLTGWTIIRSHTGLQTTVAAAPTTATPVAGRGSTTGSDTNDPVFLTHDGEDYIWVPSGATSPFGAQDFSSTLLPQQEVSTVEVDFSLDVVGQSCNLAGPVNGFMPYINGNNTLGFWWIPDGGSSQFLNFGAHGLAAGQRARFRITRTRSTGEIKAEKSTDGGATWAPQGTPFIRNIGEEVTASNTLRYGFSVLAPTGSVRLFNCIVNGVEYDIHDATVLRSSSGLKTTIVTSPVAVFDGTDDYLQLPASDTPMVDATSGEATVFVFAAPDGAGPDILFSTESTTDRGLLMFVTGTQLTTRFAGSAASINSNVADTPTPQVPKLYAMVFTSGTLAGYVSGMGLNVPVSTAGAGSAPQTSPRVGTRGYNVTFPAEGLIWSAGVLPRALTEDELDAIAARLIKEHS